MVLGQPRAQEHAEQHAAEGQHDLVARLMTIELMPGGSPGLRSVRTPPAVIALEHRWKQPEETINRVYFPPNVYGYFSVPVL